MYRLCTALGMPQHRFASIHVVGTNGKSSVTRMTAAVLEAHGLAVGASVSPHTERWSERTLIGGEEIGAEPFAAAVERVAEAAETVNRGFGPGEEVSQFEVATAAAFVAFAAAGVDVAVIEAGLGGRRDATNTIPSRVTVLTSIGLDHAKWLGGTELEIAAEKLAVLRDYTILVRGRVSSAVAALAERTAAERGATLAVAPEDPGAGIELRAPGAFQRRNFALACTAVSLFLGELDEARVREVAESLTVPGRLERVAGRPPAFVDVAHNLDGAAALAEALPELAGGRPVIACMTVLAEKDAESMLRALAPAISHLVATDPPRRAGGPIGREMLGVSAGRRWRGAGELAAIAQAAGVEAEAVEDFAEALARARDLALDRDAVLVVCGSNYIAAPARAVLRD
jgi:dihydrofolate synthase/folylpolyglutamate synthase